MRGSGGWWLGLLLALVFLPLLASGCGRPSVEAPPPEAADLAGRSVALVPPVAGAHVLVFVGTDCPISNRYVPALHRLQERFGNGVQWTAVYAGDGQSAVAVRLHLEQFDLGLPAVIDHEHQWQRHTGAQVTPEAVVYDHGGKLRYRGRIDDRYLGLARPRPQAHRQDLAVAIEAVLAGQEVTTPWPAAVGCFLPELD